MRPFFFFFFCGTFVAFAGGASTGISSSVAGGVERSESEADMLGDCGCVEASVEVQREKASATQARLKGQGQRMR